MLCNKNIHTCAAVITLLLTAVFIDRIDGSPTGAPVAACESMTPGHGVDPQPITSSPFKTEIPSGEYALMDDILQLELRSQDATASFRGFLVMAFDKNVATNQSIGTFKLPSDGQLMDCSGGVMNAATHKLNNDKKLATVQWIPPKNYMGTVVFRTTYVQTVATFWVKTESIAVSFVMEIPSSTTQAPVQTTTTLAPVVTTPSSASRSSETWISLIIISLMSFLMR